MKKKILIGLMTAVVIGAFGITAAFAENSQPATQGGATPGVTPPAGQHELGGHDRGEHRGDFMGNHEGKDKHEGKKKKEMRKHMTDGIVDHVDTATGTVYLMRRSITMAPKSVVIVVDADGTHVGSLADLAKGDHISVLVKKTLRVVDPNAAPGATPAAPQLTGYLIIKMEKPVEQTPPPAASPATTPAVTPAQ